MARTGGPLGDAGPGRHEGPPKHVTPPGPEERDAAVVASQRPAPDPGDLALGAELVEEPRLVAGNARREHVTLQHRRRDRDAGQLVDDVCEPLHGGLSAEWRRVLGPGDRDRRHALPCRQEPRERGRLHRLHLPAQARQRPAPEDPQDLRVAPFALGPTRPELAQEHGAGIREPPERVRHDPGGQSPAPRRLDAEERAVRAGPAREKAAERVVRRAEEGDRDTLRRRGARCVPVAAGVLDRDPARLAADPHDDRASRRAQRLQPLARGRRPATRPGCDLVLGQVPEPPEQVRDLVDGAGLPFVEERLEAQLGLVERRGVQERTELLLAQQLAEQVAVEGERLGAALGERSVALVHVGGHVVEQEGRRHRRRGGGLHAVDPDLAPGDPTEHLAERGQVEDVGEAFPVGLDKDREAPVAAGHAEQVRCPLALLPERRAGPRPAARQKQGSARVLAEPRGEQGRPPDRRDDEVLDRLRIREEGLLDPVEVALGQADRDPVVGPDGRDLLAQPLAQARLDRERPRGVDPPAERREQDQPPIAELVPETLDHDPAVGREGARSLPLVLQVRHEVVGRERVEVMPIPQPRDHRLPSGRAAGKVALDIADERAQRAAELDRPSDRVALPERQLARLAGRGRDDHPLRRDLQHPPAAGPEDDHVAVHPGAQLVDHLLVELAHPAARRPGLARDEDREEAAVRDRPARGDGDDPGVAPALHGVGHAVPHDPWLELGEFVRRIRPGQHREHALEHLAGQRLERRRTRHGGQQVVDGPAIHDGHRDDLLGQHVQRVARDRGRLDQALPHALGDDRALEEVATILREDHAAAHLVDAVPGAAHALQPAGDRGRRFDLDHEVDRAHVDPELER